MTPWRKWRWFGWLTFRLYALGVISGSRHSSSADGWECVTFWRGRRPYILGLQREWWRCLLGRGIESRPHIPKPEERYGAWCGRCLPCPDCGATTWGHDCEAQR